MPGSNMAGFNTTRTNIARNNIAGKNMIITNENVTDKEQLPLIGNDLSSDNYKCEEGEIVGEIKKNKKI